MAEVTVSLEKLEDIPVLFGKYDENIKLIENEFGVSVVQRDNQLKLSGAEGNALLADVYKRQAHARSMTIRFEK